MGKAQGTETEEVVAFKIFENKMIEVAGYKIYYVDFHCQWFDKDRVALFLAGLSYCGFDAGLMVIPGTYEAFKLAVTESGSPFVPFRGKEHCFQWGHILTLGYEGEAKANADFRKILRELRRKSSFVIFAHPLHPATRAFLWDSGLTPTLLKEGLLNAIELVNGYNFHRDLEIVAWYKDQIQQGQSVPVTGGCDTHYLQANQRPEIVYSNEFPPCGGRPAQNDIDYIGGVRTLVIADECTEEAVFDAVRNKRTIVEADGKLFGPACLVDALNHAGYWEKTALELQRRRNLSLCRLLLSGMDAGKIKIQQPLIKGRFKIAGSSVAVSGNDVKLRVPDIGSIEEKWVPVTVTNGESNSLTCAIHVVQPIGLDFYGTKKPGNQQPQIRVEMINRHQEMVNGKITVNIEEINGEMTAVFQGLNAGANWSCAVPVATTHPPDISRKVRVCAELADGTQRIVTKPLTFIGCRRMNENNLDWSVADIIHMDRKELVAAGNWDGPSDSSAEIRMLWTDAGLHFQAAVHDDLHCQPFHGEDLWQGDGFQIGIETEPKGNETQSSMYEFVSGLTATGPELFCNIVPTIYPGESLPKPRFFLPASCTKIEPAGDGLIYNLFFPWQYLWPIQPKVGGMFRAFFLLFDNDGLEKEVVAGSKSVMTWPEKIFAGWKSGSRPWAVITLLD